MMRQNTRVKHIGIGDDDMAALPDALAHPRRGIAIVGMGAQIDLQFTHQRLQLGNLVLRERLGREKV